MEILGLVSVPVWLLVLLTIVLTVYIYGHHKHNFFKALGIHSVPGTFMLGDLPIAFTKGMTYIDADLVKEHGKVFGVYMGNTPSLVVCDTDLIKEITVKQFNKFNSRNIMGPLKERWHSALGFSVGNRWKFLRTTLSPTFSSGKLRNMTSIIEDCLITFHSVLEERIQNNPNGFDITTLFNGLTMDVISQTGFGLEVNAQTDQDNTFVRHVRKLLDINFTKLPVLFLNLLLPDLEFIWQFFPSNFISNETYDYIRSATKSAFAARKASGSAHKDLLQFMINAHKDEKTSTEIGYTYEDFKKRGLTDDEVLVNAILLLAAGYDTTSAALASCVYDLVFYPDVQEKLIQEVDAEIGGARPSYDNVFKLRYLDMVMRETLRMHPPVGKFDRVCQEDTVINGVQFKKGLVVEFPVLALHYLPDYWENPNEYNPERFAPENEHKIDQCAYMAFGNGPRHCVAMRLAHVEFKMTMVSILQKYRFVKADQLQVPMPFARNIIIKPAKPVMIKAIPRKSFL